VQDLDPGGLLRILRVGDHRPSALPASLFPESTAIHVQRLTILGCYSGNHETCGVQLRECITPFGRLLQNLVMHARDGVRGSRMRVEDPLKPLLHPSLECRAIRPNRHKGQLKADPLRDLKPG
jgi:hypothetical protein